MPSNSGFTVAGAINMIDGAVISHFGGGQTDYSHGDGRGGGEIASSP